MVEKMLGKKEKSGNMKKKSAYPALIGSPGRWTGNKINFKGGPTVPCYIGYYDHSFNLVSRSVTSLPLWHKQKYPLVYLYNSLVFFFIILK